MKLSLKRRWHVARAFRRAKKTMLFYVRHKMVQGDTMHFTFNLDVFSENIVGRWGAKGLEGDLQCGKIVNVDLRSPTAIFFAECDAMEPDPTSLLTPWEIHETYLNACKAVSADVYNPKAQKWFSALTPEQQYLDVVLAAAINSRAHIVQKKLREDVERLGNKRGIWAASFCHELDQLIRRRLP